NRGERATYIGVAGILAPTMARWLEPGAERPVFHLMLLTLALVALMANITAVRRFVFIYRELRARETPPPPSSGETEPQEALQGWFQRAWLASVLATVVDY